MRRFIMQFEHPSNWKVDVAAITHVHDHAFVRFWCDWTQLRGAVVDVKILEFDLHHRLHWDVRFDKLLLEDESTLCPAKKKTIVSRARKVARQKNSDTLVVRGCFWQRLVTTGVLGINVHFTLFKRQRTFVSVHLFWHFPYCPKLTLSHTIILLKLSLHYIDSFLFNIPLIFIC